MRRKGLTTPGRIGLTWIALWILAGARATAWGPTGHEIISRVALFHLTPVARDALDEALAPHELSDYEITCWADTIRGHREHRELYPSNSRWHYIDFDVKQSYNETFTLTVSEDGHDIVSQIVRWRDELKDGRLTGEQRLNALRFLIHFIGDVHQPLHCAYRYGDLGGNMIPVNSFSGKKYSFGPNTEMDYPPSLHAVWDDYLVQELVGRRRARTVARALHKAIEPEQAQRWMDDEVLSWAVESYWLARKKAYRWADGDSLPAKWSRPGMDLTSENYIDAQAPIVTEQLQKAGVRLAHVLNQLFDPDYGSAGSVEPSPDEVAEDPPAAERRSYNNL